MVKVPFIFHGKRVQMYSLDRAVRAIANSNVDYASTDRKCVAIDCASTTSPLSVVQRNHLNATDQLPVGHVIHVQIAVGEHGDDQLPVFFFEIKPALNLTVGQFQQIRFGNLTLSRINSNQVIIT